MTKDYEQQACLDFVVQRISKTGEWRMVQATRFPGDEKNLRAAERLKELAAAATEIPDDVWKGLKEHFHWSTEKFGEVVSATNRNVVFRNNTPDFLTYLRNLLVNVRATFS